MIAQLVHVYAVWLGVAVAGTVPSIYFYVKGVRDA